MTLEWRGVYVFGKMQKKKKTNKTENRKCKASVKGPFCFAFREQRKLAKIEESCSKYGLKAAL